jgi:hypothetical protein
MAQVRSILFTRSSDLGIDNGLQIPTLWGNDKTLAKF